MRTPIDFRALPSDPVERHKVLERRADPTSDKPRISPELEAELSEIEEKSAQCYIDAEDKTYRFKRAADRINGWVPRYGLRAGTKDE